jgi:hypothetical protein
VAEAGGPMQAIQAKMQGWARDPDLIRSLLHVNALDVAVDGLNEVGADTRQKIVAFVEDLPKANVALTTQPIAWEPPQAGATRRYELQPLDRAQISEFLLGRRHGWRGRSSKARLRGGLRRLPRHRPWHPISIRRSGAATSSSSPTRWTSPSPPS